MKEGKLSSALMERYGIKEEHAVGKVLWHSLNENGEIGVYDMKFGNIVVRNLIAEDIERISESHGGSHSHGTRDPDGPERKEEKADDAPKEKPEKKEKTKLSPKNPLSNWVYEDAKAYAEELIEEYGEPDILTDNMASWDGGISEFDRVYVMDESIPHCCPKPHDDYVYSTMKINVPLELMGAVAKASESIIVDQLKNEVTARCADITANAITLGFVQKLVDGEIKPEDAKEEYERHILEGITPDWFDEGHEDGPEEK